MRGARCPGWGKQLWEKENYKCDDCPCKFCCEEQAMHDVDHEVGSLFEYVKKTSKSFTDPAWIERYGKHNITIGYVYNYAGNAYKNITGQYAGRSPKIDDVNWEYVGRSK